MKENSEITKFQDNEITNEPSSQKDNQQTEQDHSSSPIQEYDDINIVKKDNKDISIKDSLKLNFKSNKEQEKVDDKSELLTSNLPLNENHPWDFANSYPERVIKGTEVKIYPFPNDITKEEIYENFNILGEIIDVNILPFSKEGKIKTMNNIGLDAKNNQKIDYCECLVRFKDLEAVDKVLKLTNAKFDGQLLKIEKSKEECNIFVGNLKKLWSESHVNNLFRSKLRQITDIKFLVDPNSNNKNRGFCFLRFDNPQFAKLAFENLSKNPFIDDQLLSIDWADDYDSDNDVNKTQIHISGITPLIKSEELYRVFGQYGHIEQMKLSRDFENKSRTDYGFITFSSEKEAESAIKEFNYKEYFPIPLKVQYARKISAIINHKKRTENSSFLNKKRKNSNYSEDSDFDGFDRYNKKTTKMNQNKNLSRNISTRDKYKKHEINNNNDEIKFNAINHSIANKTFFKNNLNNNELNKQNILSLKNTLERASNSINSFIPNSRNLNFPNLIVPNKIINNFPNTIKNNNYNPINNLPIQPNNMLGIGNIITNNRPSVDNINPNNNQNNLQNFNNQQRLFNQNNQINQVGYLNSNQSTSDKNSKINLPLKINNFDYNQVYDSQNHVINFPNPHNQQYQQNSLLVNDLRNQSNKNYNPNFNKLPNEIHNQIQPSHGNNFNHFNNPPNPQIINSNNNINPQIPQNFINDSINNHNYSNYNNLKRFPNTAISEKNHPANPSSYQNSNPTISNIPMIQNMQTFPNQNINFKASRGFHFDGNTPFIPVNNMEQSNPIPSPNQNLNLAGNNFNFRNGFPNTSNYIPHTNPNILINNNLTGNSDSNFKSNDYSKQPRNLNYHFKY